MFRRASTALALTLLQRDATLWQSCGTRCNIHTFAAAIPPTADALQDAAFGAVGALRDDVSAIRAYVLRQFEEHMHRDCSVQ